jgi:hypothetical protein
LEKIVKSPTYLSDHPGGGTHTWYFDEVLLQENGVAVKPRLPKAGAMK